MYNQGVDLKAAISKCSVGVRTMFNDARRAIRDITFRVWAAYVSRTRSKVSKFKKYCLLHHWFVTWKKRWRRFRERGYFYDDDSDDDSDEEGGTLGSHSRMFKRSMSGLLMADEAPKSEIMARMNEIPPHDGDSSEDESKSPTPLPVKDQRTGGLARFKKMSMRVKAVSIVHNHYKIDKSLKIFAREVVDKNEVWHCERKSRMVDLVSRDCQTDPVTFMDPALVAAAEAAAAAAVARGGGDLALTHSSKGTGPSVSSIVGKGKMEKAMSVEAAMALIPDIYSQYLSMLSNPGPDTIGKHLNLVTFTKHSLVRKFGIKSLATKQLKSFISLLLSKKTKEHARLRTFGRLLGLGPPGSTIENAQPYSVKHVDFFFKFILTGLFPVSKKLEGVMCSKNRLIDTDKTVEKIADIVPQIHKKGGFLLAYMERYVEDMPQVESKGIEYVNADDVIEYLTTYSEAEEMMKRMTFRTVRCVITFQQKYSAVRRNRLARGQKGEVLLAEAYDKVHEPGVVATESEMEDLLKKIGCPAHHATLEKIWRGFKDEVDGVEAKREEEKKKQKKKGEGKGESKVGKEGKEDEKTAEEEEEEAGKLVGKLFAKHIWGAGLRPNYDWNKKRETTCLADLEEKSYQRMETISPVSEEATSSEEKEAISPDTEEMEEQRMEEISPSNEGE